jgi:1-acyl-sn-glycerol-3-phosphate acyltransferase
MYVPPRWIRRLITIPLGLLIAAVALLGSPLLLIGAAFVSRFVPGKWRPLRIFWFLLVYLFMNVLAQFILLFLWLIAGFGFTIGNERSINRHYKLLAWFLQVLVRSAKRTFKLETSGPQSAGDFVPSDGGTIVLSRHAGPGDSFLLAEGLANWAGLRPRIVLKDTMQYDPAIDILVNRLPCRFVRSRDRNVEEELDAMGELAKSMGPNDAVLIFPEGGNFSPRRREKSIAYLERIERPDLAERARNLTHLLAPKPAGTLRLIDAAPNADILVVGHGGLEDFTSLKAIWKCLPMDKEVESIWWQIPAAEVPTDENNQVLWLYDQWEIIDTWLDERNQQDEKTQAPA